MLNFGFSGNGRTEPEVAALLAEIDAAIFVMDTLANTPADALTDRMIACVKAIRARHPQTPILLLDQRASDAGAILPVPRQNDRAKTAALTAAFDQLKTGDPNLHFREGRDLTGTDGEGTVDGSHPTDLGMMRYADALEPVLRTLL